MRSRKGTGPDAGPDAQMRVEIRGGPQDARREDAGRDTGSIKARTYDALRQRVQELAVDDVAVVGQGLQQVVDLVRAQKRAELLERNLGRLRMLHPRAADICGIHTRG